MFIQDYISKGHDDEEKENKTQLVESIDKRTQQEK